MKLYKYIYAEMNTGKIHTQLEHEQQHHMEEECYVIKSQEVTDLTPEEVELWQSKLKEEKDKGKESAIDWIQLDKDYNAWLTQKQIDLYGQPLKEVDIEKDIKEVLEHDSEIPESISDMLKEYLDSDK